MHAEVHHGASKVPRVVERRVADTNERHPVGETRGAGEIICRFRRLRGLLHAASSASMAEFIFRENCAPARSQINSEHVTSIYIERTTLVDRNLV